MFLKPPEALAQEYDTCIVGAGPAGLTLAMELVRLDPQHRVLIIEAGGERPTHEANPLDDSIEVLSPEHHHPPYECTNKGFGGTTETWGGRCVSYDEIDFMDRPILNGKVTWDLGIFEEIKPYYVPAAQIFECGKPDFELTSGRPIAAGFVNGDVTDNSLERWSLPTRFGHHYRNTIAGSRQITVTCGTIAEKLMAVGGQIGITAAERPDGTPTTVKSKQFVLAAGTQESTRLLLASPEVFANRGGTPDALGKYYQGHIRGQIASIKFSGDPKATDFGYLLDEGVYVRRRFKFPTKTLLRENLLNTAMWLDNPLYYDPSHSSGTMSFIYLMMIAPFIGSRLAPPAILESVTKGKVNAVGAHLKNVLLGFPRSFIEPAQIFRRRYFAKRKLPGVCLYSPSNEYALYFHAEQQPLESNRMTLAEDGRTLRIEYGYSDTDAQSVIRCHEILDEWLRHCGAGELTYYYPKDELVGRIKTISRDGIHQVGTTRMSRKQEGGVVDTDLKVWGTENLYVCCCGVFPTSGHANPTFMLGAFACRLAEHLTGKAERPPSN